MNIIAGHLFRSAASLATGGTVPRLCRRRLTTVQLLDAAMHFLSSHHWQPLVLAAQLAQSEKRKHCSSVLSGGGHSIGERRFGRTRSDACPRSPRGQRSSSKSGCLEMCLYFFFSFFSLFFGFKVLFLLGFVYLLVFSGCCQRD